MIRYILKCWPVVHRHHLRHTAIGHHHHAQHIVRLVRCAWVAVPVGGAIVGGALIPGGWSSTGGANSTGGYAPPAYGSEFGPGGFASMPGIGGELAGLGGSAGLGNQVTEAIANMPGPTPGGLPLGGNGGNVGNGGNGEIPPAGGPLTGPESGPGVGPGTSPSPPTGGGVPVDEPPLTASWLMAAGLALLLAWRRAS